jgi:hypothetical protein
MMLWKEKVVYMSGMTELGMNKREGCTSTQFQSNSKLLSVRTIRQLLSLALECGAGMTRRASNEDSKILQDLQR